MPSALQNTILLALAALAIAQNGHAPPREIDLRITDLPASARILRPDLFGYSIEPSTLAQYTSSDILNNLLKAIADVTTSLPPIRIGGISADRVTIVPDGNMNSAFPSNESDASDGFAGRTRLEVSARWFNQTSSYFSAATDITYCLNFRDSIQNWDNTVTEVKLVLQSYGSKVRRFELGNEVDHYAYLNWRPKSWSVSSYAQEWKRLRGIIQKQSIYQSQPIHPKFQAAVFAESRVGWNIVDLTSKANVTNDDQSISGYSVHFYPQSTCTKHTAASLSLAHLCDHLRLVESASHLIESQNAARTAGAPLIYGETNSVACSGKAGISDTFGAALWTVDHALLGASMGIEQIFFHLGAESQYSAFTPLPYIYQGVSLEAGIRANFYSHLFIAEILKGGGDRKITALSDANASDFGGYAILEADKLTKLVFLDMGIWNTTVGTSNPSTLETKPSGYIVEARRPETTLNIHISWPAGSNVTAIRLEAPGTNAKSQVTVAGQTIDVTGARGGTRREITLTVGAGGLLTIGMQRAEGLLLSHLP